VSDINQRFATATSNAGTTLADQSHLRFAVGTFTTWQRLGDMLQGKHLPGFAHDSFNCLALERVFSGKTIVALSQEPVHIQRLAFPHNAEPIGCTSGPLADCLAERLRSGAPSLKDALGFWLVPRHAAHFDEAVEGGSILLWIRLANAEDERRACHSLLANSSNSVGVHDLVGPISGHQ
jgi:hypothetical protein